MRAFLKRTVVELVYKFNEKSTASVCKGKSTANVPFKLFWKSYTYNIYVINGHQPRSHNSCSRMRMQGDENVGHALYNLTPRLSLLDRCEKSLAEVSGIKVNRKLAMAWKYHVSTICMDLKSMLTVWRNYWSLYLLLESK